MTNRDATTAPLVLSECLEFAERQQEWLVQTIEALAVIESPSTDKHAVDRCGRDLAQRLTAIGGRVRTIARDEAGDIIRAEFGSGVRQVLLLGHIDTVWPVGQLARMPVKRVDNRLYGPGTFDMKAGIGLTMLAARALEQCGGFPCRIVMLWTTDEEIGSIASRAQIEEEARRSDAVLVIEPALPGGAVKTTRKGCGDFLLNVHGIAAHAGVDPEKGASAVRELARQILAVEQLQDLERGVSVNVGIIGGGTRSNVIADHAWARIDVRSPTASDAERVDAALRALRPTLAGTSVEVSGGFARPAMERGAGTVRLYELARGVAAELGHELREGGTGGGSDGNFTAAIGVPTLDGLGAVGDFAHGLQEHVELGDLPWRAALLAGLIARIATAG
jgi:glutamate carboxypeptidase